VGAKRYERNVKRRDTRAGHYERKLHTTAGAVTLKVPKLRQMKLKNVALLVADGIDDTLSYYGFPPEHWRRIGTNNPLERILREVRRRTQVVGSFPDGHAALMLVAARLRHVSGSKWGTRRYLDMGLLRRHLQEAS
jgi:putative transposase